jgi:hypothetical protein
VCAAWLSLAVVVAVQRARRGVRAGRGALARGRLKSPTVYLFSAYLLVAALVTPISRGESLSPLLGLAVALPAAYALATLSAIGDERPSAPVAVALALLHGGVVLAASAAILALASPRFVPTWLR